MGVLATLMRPTEAVESVLICHDFALRFSELTKVMRLDGIDQAEDEDLEMEEEGSRAIKGRRSAMRCPVPSGWFHCRTRVR